VGGGSDDFEDEIGAAARGDDLAADPFFGGGGGGGGGGGQLPVFVEEADAGAAWAEDEPAANWRSGSGFSGPRTAAARFERERLGADQRRYRDSAAAPRATAPAAGAADASTGAGAGASAVGATAAAAPDARAREAERRLEGLAGRKRKRAERALRFEQGRGAGSSAGLLGVGGVSAAVAARYTEAFYGTERDEGARLKHRDRLRVADRRELKRAQPPARQQHVRPPAPPPQPPQRYAAQASDAKPTRMVFV